MKIKGSAIFLVLTMVTMLAIVGYSMLGMKRIESKLLPMLIGSSVFVSAAARLAMDTLGNPEKKSAETVEKWRGYLLNGAWLGGFGIAILLLGFLVAMPAFMVLYMRWLGTRWRTAAFTAVITPAVLYVIFEIVMKAELYRGVVFAWLGS